MWKLFFASFRRAAAYQEIEKFIHEGEVTQFRCFNWINPLPQFVT